MAQCIHIVWLHVLEDEQAPMFLHFTTVFGWILLEVFSQSGRALKANLLDCRNVVLFEF
jgi:hypothetical protein